MNDTLKISFGPAQIDRVQNEWSKLAGEPVTVENIDLDFYAFGSELACLRLLNKFKNSPDEMKVEFSANKKTWFFVKYKKY